MLESKGAVLIDADAIAREVVVPGGPAYGPVVERFGDAVVAPDGTIDRKALAEIVFHDAQALADLNAVTHPVIGQVMVERRAAAERAGAVVVMDIPLLKATHREQIGFDVVVVVDTPVDMAVQRLVDERGFDRTDAEARLAAQITREERRALADVVLDNGGDIDALQAQVDRLWSDLLARAVPAP
jgi:dephospho-CoA kinase